MQKLASFTLRIPRDDNADIKLLAENLGMSQNALILLAMNLFRQSYKDIIV